MKPSFDIILAMTLSISQKWSMSTLRISICGVVKILWCEWCNHWEFFLNLYCCLKITFYYLPFAIHCEENWLKGVQEDSANFRIHNIMYSPEHTSPLWKWCMIPDICIFLTGNFASRHSTTQICFERSIQIPNLTCFHIQQIGTSYFQIIKYILIYKRNLWRET